MMQECVESYAVNGVKKKVEKKKEKKNSLETIMQLAIHQDTFTVQLAIVRSRLSGTTQ